MKHKPWCNYIAEGQHSICGKNEPALPPVTNLWTFDEDVLRQQRIKTFSLLNNSQWIPLGCFEYLLL